MQTCPESFEPENASDSQSVHEDDSMNPEQIALFNRMDAYFFDQVQTVGVEKLYSSLSLPYWLSKENAWEREFVMEVMEEYKRFVFLAIAVDHPVIPSDHVEQAWRLHLSNTRDYWDYFCPQVLQTQLHHSFPQIGRQEAARSEKQYMQTLESYENFFGENPPSHIWPTPQVRFDPNRCFVRLNAQKKWIIPKPPIPRHTAGALVASLGPLYIATHQIPGTGMVSDFCIAAMSVSIGYSLVIAIATSLDALNRPYIVGVESSGC